VNAAHTSGIATHICHVANMLEGNSVRMNSAQMKPMFISTHCLRCFSTWI